MMRRALAFATVLLVLIAIQAPATLLDAALARASDGRMRVLSAEGTLWAGQGTFASLSPDGRAAQPWLVGRWTAEFAELPGGRLGWRIGQSGRTVLRLAVASDGVEIVQADIDVPLKPLLDSIPHPLARAGWRGAAHLESPGWRCDWHRACDGRLRLTWLDAGVELVPGRRFGDYELTATARAHAGTLDLRTLAGDLRIEGSGGWDEHGHPRFDGRVEGPVDIVGRLPNVMDGVAFPTGQPGTAEIRLR